MKTLKICIIFLICLFQFYFSSAQKPLQNKGGYYWNNEQKVYQKNTGFNNQNIISDTEKRQYLLGYGKKEGLIWILPNSNNTSKSGWEYPKSGEIEAYNLQKANYLYQIQEDSLLYYSVVWSTAVDEKSETIRKYLGERNIHKWTEKIFLPLHDNKPYVIPTIENPNKNYKLNELAEDIKLLGKPVVELDNCDSIGRYSVHYANKINLHLLGFSGTGNHILVVDTLYIPRPTSPKINAYLGANINFGRFYLKIIANCIVYEQPIIIGFWGKSDLADLVISSNTTFFKSIYADLNINKVPIPPMAVLYKNLGNTYTFVYRDPILEYPFGEENIMLNRLFINIMESINSVALNNTNDEWEKDKLIEQFQTYRFNRLSKGYLAKDNIYQQKFFTLCKEFDSKFKNYKIEKRRELNDLIILVDGEVNKLPLKPMNYYVLPTKAKLLPVMRDTTSLLGTINYNATGDTKLRLTLETQLTYDESQLDVAQKQLAEKEIILQRKLPKKIVSIDEQPLKINGKTVGKIIPISNKLVRLEINLVEETKALIELFPKAGATNFKIDFNVTGENERLTQDFSIDIDKMLLKKLDYQKPLDSFNILENSPLISNTEIVSNLDASKPNEGALEYVEVLAEFHFKNKTDLKGPFRLSSYNTLASKMTIPFLKYENDYKITISGRAIYENGQRNIMPFSPKINEIISVDEDAFKK